MRPHLIYFALTSTAILLSGCSSTRSTYGPLGGTSGVASSASDFNEYDRDPPAARQSSRMAAEPAPVPPARGISFSRMIDATPAGFRRAIGYTDSCTGDACATDSCSTDTCGTEGCLKQDGCATEKPRCCLGFHLFKFKRLGCFKKLCGDGCTDTVSCTDEAACTAADSCTDQGCNTCAAPSNGCTAEGRQAHDCHSETRPRIAPPLGERRPAYEEGASSGFSVQPKTDDADAETKAPGMVPDIPVDPIGQSRSVQPQVWKDQPLYGTVKTVRPTEQRMIRLEPPIWRDGTQSRAEFANTQNLLTPSASTLKSPVFKEGTPISIQPLIRIEDPTTGNSL